MRRINRAFYWLIPISSLMIIVLLVIISSLFDIDASLWKHLSEYLLPPAFLNSLIVAITVTILVWIIGVPSAWFITNYDFPLRKFFSWGFILPLAIPPFVMSIVMMDILDFSGTLQKFLRNILNSNTQIWQGRSWWGLSLTLSLTLFPYVYLMTRIAFINQGKTLVEASKILGVSKAKLFFKFAVPYSKPWWISGIILVWMEILSDFGAFSAFGIESLTTLIYKVWFGFFSLTGALQISFILIVLALILMSFQNRFNKKKIYLSNDYKQDKTKLPIRSGIIITFFLFIVLIISFFIPILRLIIWAIADFDISKIINLWQPTKNVIILAVSTGFLTTLVGTILAISNRYFQLKSTLFLTKISTLGYAIPAIVLTAGLYIPIIKFNAWIIKVTNYSFLSSFSIAITVLILSYRFINIGYNTATTNFQRVPYNYEWIAKTFDLSNIKIFFKIHLPLISKGLIIGYLIVAIDVLKELPITLITRPPGWDTLAIKIYEHTSAGMYSSAALPSLIIIFISIFPIVLITSYIDKDINAQQSFITN